MKRLIIIAITLVCGAILSNNFAEKPKKEKYDSQQMYLDSVQRTEKIRQLEEELRLAEEKKERALKLAEEKKERALNDVRDKMYRNSMEDMPIPCQDEAKGDDEHYGALGMSEHLSDAPSAVRMAIQDAKFQIATQIGGETIEFNDLEVQCRQIFRDKYGSFGAFVVVRMPKKNKTDKVDSPSE